MSLENVIRQCAPTMANIKTGSLFPVPFKDKGEIQKEIIDLNRLLEPKGIVLIPLRFTDKNVCLLYMYRPDRLRKDLTSAKAKEILKETGYEGLTPEESIIHLIERLHVCPEFPHEIGLFLSYPEDDVKGFIENHAKNFKFSGLWKVYGDETVARSLFDKYKKCTDIYCAFWNKGFAFERLAVAS